jgi:hypothetical protein
MIVKDMLGIISEWCQRRLGDDSIYSPTSMAEVYTECGYHVDELISVQRTNWVVDQVDQENLYHRAMGRTAWERRSFVNKLEAEII